ncbi:MAG: Hsp20/alpha crystallin family protein [Labilithrix sp.]|nr:Hsp20/alpha crystallin family protein [Labilithrix sp.]
MRRLLGWDPFREMAPFIPMDEAGLAFIPAFEIKETKNAYEFRADMPGVKESDLELTVSGNRLTISGKREAEREEESERYFATERVYGSFVRSFTLPEDVDAPNVSAKLESGVLSITVPKKPETQPRRIAVGAAKAQAEAQAEQPQRESATQIKEGKK